jgi:hypothetical protein
MLMKETGTFRGAITAHGVNLTEKSQLPQWCMTIQATEKYDFEKNEWMDYTFCQDNTLSGYFCLFTKEGKPTFHIGDIMATVEWDGTSLSGLNDMDLVGSGVQFNVEDHIWEGQSKLQITKVQPFEATPSKGGVRKMSEADAKALDAHFATQLKKIGGAPKPASAPPSAPKPSTPPPTPGVVTQKKKAPKKQPTPETEVPDTPVEAEQLFPYLTNDAPKAPPLMPSVGPKKGNPEDAVTMSKDEAWEAAMIAKSPQVTDQEVVKSWQKNVKRVIDECEGYISDDDLNEADWAGICKQVVAETGLPF